jgi:AcrR family transcriptional regulator
MGRHREFDVDRALEAALAVFWAKGYEGTTYDDLTHATRVARPGLYAAFGNKEALFRRALVRYNDLYLGYMPAALTETTSYRVVEHILRGSAELSTRYSDRTGCLGLNGALACSDGVEPVRQALVDGRAASESALRERLQRAKETGDLPASSDCAALAAFVMAVAQGISVQAKAGASKQLLQFVVDQALRGWPASKA